MSLNVSINPDPDQDPNLAMPASLVMRVTVDLDAFMNVDVDQNASNAVT